jgi:hypothetical protein
VGKFVFRSVNYGYQHKKCLSHSDREWSLVSQMKANRKNS